MIRPRIEAYAQGGKVSLEIDRFPDVCPVCKTGNEFIDCYAYYFVESNGPTVEHRLQVVFRCPRQKCQSLFFGIYTGNYLCLDVTGVKVYTEKKTFPEPIPEISEKFPIIYNQALKAENNGLDEIDGAGYGKALEFLVKDYLIYLDHTKEDEIRKSKRLGVLIKEFSDTNMQITASRAAWLRNDEVHYEREWKEADVTNLKELIELTVSHIRNAELTKKYAIDMDPDKNKEENKQE